MLEDAEDDARVLDEGQDAHLVSASRTGQGVDFVNLLEEASPVGSSSDAEGLSGGMEVVTIGLAPRNAESQGLSREITGLLVALVAGFMTKRVSFRLSIRYSSQRSCFRLPMSMRPAAPAAAVDSVRQKTKTVGCVLKKTLLSAGFRFPLKTPNRPGNTLVPCGVHPS